ncbi:hypothetical protein ABFY57_11940 [Paenibacillus polymyxa]|uniref:hypothetical protein n=1 Tax=Paenibacillus polymyxa TaxID=1406 RepID=UPI00201958D0|nr:hypothetical protein [Paenibacillus polymyxa]UQQ36156.1 hypothetical protein LMH85_04355 [Paenibacillus polymyxa]
MMTTNFFEHRDAVAQNMIALMRKNGYSRQTFSKLTAVPRPAVDQLLLSGGENINESVFNSYILQINQAFDLHENYFLTTKEIAKSSSTSSVNNEQSERVKELYFGLDCIMDIYSMYIR